MNGKHDPVFVGIFLSYLFWEVAPTSILLWIIWCIPQVLP